MKLGFIGMGFMANAILKGILDKNILKADEICAFDIDISKLQVQKEKGIKVFSSAGELLNEAEAVIVAVKPQNSQEILRLDFSKVKTVISIMAGVNLAKIRNFIGEKPGIVRVMPNMPCSIGHGFSALAFDGADEYGKKLAFDIFSACGEAIELDESMFDAVTSISGSGPAYVYMFISAMIKGGMEGGLSFEEAKKMTLATFSGAVEMVRGSNDDINIMIDRVCSKGGTTIQAIDHFRNNDLERIIADGVAAARKRSNELGKL